MFWVVGDAGRVARLSPPGGAVEVFDLGEPALVRALAHIGDSTFALVGSQVVELDAAGTVARKREMAQLGVADICAVRVDDSTALALATAAGVIVVDPASFATRYSHDVDNGVGLLCAAGDGRVLMAENDGYLARLRLKEGAVEPYGPGRDLGGVSLAAIAADGDAVCSATIAGHLTWYAAPGPPAAQVRLSHGRIPSVAMTGSWVLAAVGGEMVALDRDSPDHRVTLVSEPPASKCSIAIGGEQMAGLDADGRVVTYFVAALGNGTRLTPDATIATHLDGAHRVYG